MGCASQKGERVSGGFRAIIFTFRSFCARAVV
jgi:hypothetical protein